MYTTPFLHSLIFTYSHTHTHPYPYSYTHTHTHTHIGIHPLLSASSPRWSSSLPLSRPFVFCLTDRAPRPKPKAEQNPLRVETHTQTHTHYTASQRASKHGPPYSAEAATAARSACATFVAFALLGPGIGKQLVREHHGTPGSGTGRCSGRDAVCIYICVCMYV